MTDMPLAAGFAPVSEEEWRGKVAGVLKGTSFETLVTRTLDGIGIQPLYPASQTAAPVFSATKKATAPAWDIVQRADIPDPAQANEQILRDLEGGAGGIAIVLPQSVSAGRHGVAISTIADLDRLFEGVELDLVSVRLDSGRHGLWMVPLLLELYAQRGLPAHQCRLNFAIDPIGRLALGGSMVTEQLLSERMSKLLGQAQNADFAGPVFAADSRVYHGAGASPAQELGIILATAVEYLRMLEAQGCDLQSAAGLLSLLLTTDADLFQSIAKLRAARLLWARLLEVMELEHVDVSIDVETSRRMMAKHTPHVNMLRTATAVLAAGIAGAGSITALPMTTACGLPDAFARRMACNSHLILQEESGVGRILDAAAGSGYVEALTHELASHAWRQFQDIEAHGGMIGVLKSGHLDSALADTRSERAALLGERKQPLTGVTEFPDLDENALEVLDIAVPDGWDPAGNVDAEEQQISCGPLKQVRDAEPYEQLRDRGTAYRQANGKPARIFLANLGAAHDFTSGATWVRNLFAVAGIETTDSGDDSSPATLAIAFKQSGLTIACICSSDTVYAEQGEAAISALKQAGATWVYLAGDPASQHHQLAKAGVDQFLTQGIDVRRVLQGAQSLLAMVDA